MNGYEYSCKFCNTRFTVIVHAPGVESFSNREVENFSTIFACPFCLQVDGINIISGGKIGVEEDEEK